MEAQGIVNEPYGEGEREQDVRDDEVERVQSCRVHFLQVGTDDVQGEAVPGEPHQEHHTIDKGHEDLGIVAVVVQRGTPRIVCGRGKGLGNRSGSHDDSSTYRRCNKLNVAIIIREQQTLLKSNRMTTS